MTLLRVTTSIRSNFFVYFIRKNLLFLFYTSTFTKPHHFIYSIHLFNKIFIFLQFFIIPSLTAPLSLRPTTINDHSTPNHHHHHSINIIKENQPTKQETQDRHDKPQRKTLKNQTKITEPRREREGEKASPWNSNQCRHCITTTDQCCQQPNLNLAKNANPNTNHRET